MLVRQLHPRRKRRHPIQISLPLTVSFVLSILLRLVICYRFLMLNGVLRLCFSVCRWTNCGGGSCNKTSPFTYDCRCSEGYFNLLNVSAFPCYKECMNILLFIASRNLYRMLCNWGFLVFKPVVRKIADWVRTLWFFQVQSDWTVLTSGSRWRISLLP